MPLEAVKKWRRPECPPKLASMLSGRLLERESSPRVERHRRDVVLAFVAERLPSPKTQRVALQILKTLFELSRRYGRSLEVTERRALDIAYREWADNSSDRVQGWRYALPIAVPIADRREVSRVIGAVMAAADPRFRATS